MACVINDWQYLHVIFVIFRTFTLVWTRNISIQDASFDELCKFKGTCLNCGKGGCDDLCDFYDNVCCDNTSSKNALLEKWQYECVRMFPEMYDLNLDCRGSSQGVYGVYMVTKCSKNWTDDFIKAKCEGNSHKEILERIPVCDSHFEMVVYKNMFCAFCNKLSLERIKFWKFDLMCSADEDDRNLGDCFIRYINRPHRMCAVNEIESCPENGTINSALRDKCEIGISQNVYVWKHVNVFDVYKNEFCAQCNFVTENLQCWAFQAFTCWPKDLPPYTHVQAMIMFTLDVKSDVNSLKVFNDTACGDGVLYNPLDKRCLNVTCLPLLNTCISGKCHLVEIKALKLQTQNDSSLFIFDMESIILNRRYFVRDNNTYVCMDDDQYFKYLEFMNMQTSTENTESTDTPNRQITTVSCAPNMLPLSRVLLLVLVVIINK